MKKSIALEQAQALLLSLASPLQECTIPLFSASGRVLSQDIRANQDLPSFTKSPLDGYALRSDDTKDAKPATHVSLKVIEEIRAGFAAQKEVVPGTAIKVMTGAPIPNGADVVIKYEDVERTGDTIQVFQALKSGSNIIKAGEDIVRDEVIAERGMTITPPLVGLLAGLGIVKVPVYSRVKVAIISTGDELLAPSEELQPGKIYNSSLYSLEAQCRELGAKPIVMGIVPDVMEAVAERISQGLAEADIVITTGGVSVGDYDVVKDALVNIGANIVFWKVAMKPGSPIVAAVKENKLIIGLSGNPAAAMVTFDLLVVPVIKKMLGQDKYLPVKIKCILADNFKKASPQRRFLRARLLRENGLDYIKLTGDQGNGVLKSMIGCNVLGDVPAGSGPLIAGQEITAFIVGNIDGSYLEPVWVNSWKQAVSE